MNGKRYFNEIEKEMCLHQLFSKPHNYFSTKSPRTLHFHQHCTSFWNPSLKKIGVLFLRPFPHCRLHLTQRLTVLTSTHWSPQTACICLNFNWRNFFCGQEFNNSTPFEPNVWKLFHFDVHWVRTVSICVFKVKYGGREIPCDYTEPVLSR